MAGERGETDVGRAAGGANTIAMERGGALYLVEEARSRYKRKRVTLDAGEDAIFVPFRLRGLRRWDPHDPENAAVEAVEGGMPYLLDHLPEELGRKRDVFTWETDDVDEEADMQLLLRRGKGAGEEPRKRKPAGAAMAAKYGAAGVIGSRADEE